MTQLLRCTLLGLLALSWPDMARGQDTSSVPRAEVAPTVTIKLVDGTLVRGIVVSETDSAIVVDSPALGRLEIERERIQSISYEGQPETEPGPSEWRLDPDYNSLLLVPTSETLPQGDVYYRNFELLFNNVGYAPADQFNLSAMAVFPITADLRIVSLGAKLRLASRESSPVGLAVSGSYWFVDDESFSTLSAIASIGDRRRSLTLAANYGFSEGENEFFFLVGGDYQVGNGFKLLFEYGNSESAISEDNDFKGIINVGFRLFWETVSFSLAGFRPLEETGDFIAFPIAMFSSHF